MHKRNKNTHIHDQTLKCSRLYSDVRTYRGRGLGFLFLSLHVSGVDATAGRFLALFLRPAAVWDFKSPEDPPIATATNVGNFFFFFDRIL